MLACLRPPKADFGGPSKWLSRISFRNSAATSGCSSAWFRAPALGAGSRRFESSHPDKVAVVTKGAQRPEEATATLPAIAPKERRRERKTVSLRTETAYKADRAGKLAPRSKARGSAREVNAEVVQLEFAFLSGEISSTGALRGNG